MTTGSQTNSSKAGAIAAVVPAFNEASRIADVVRSLPAYLSPVVVVNDASSDNTGQVIEMLAREDERVVCIHHERNLGVGGAVVSGFKAALEREAQIVVKIDGDGQMPLECLPALLRPLIAGEADYSKGNRFRDLDALRRMPLVRRIGNLALSFSAKCATGYWDCFDPTNGFLAVRADILRFLPLDKLDRTYFFEHSLLIQLYLAGAVIRDVPMPAKYGNESSHLRISRVIFDFPPKLLSALARRIILKNYLYDFNMESLYLLAGLPLLIGGAIYGGYNWVHYLMLGVGAPTGTVVVPTLAIILGVQFLLAATEIDLRSTPTKPVNGGPLSIQVL